MSTAGTFAWLMNCNTFSVVQPSTTAGLVTVGGLALFSTETGDAWILDPADHLAARVARDGDPELVYFEETDTTFAIGWKGNYRVDGEAFVYTDRETGRMSSILGYPTRKISELG